MRIYLITFWKGREKTMFAIPYPACLRRIHANHLVLSLLVALLTCTLGCGWFGGSSGPQGQMMGMTGGQFGKPERPKFKIPVTVQTLKRGRMYAYLQAVGTVVPVKEIELKPEMTGRVFFTRRWLEGDDAKKGNIFAAMDDRELKLNINEAELQLEIAKAAVKPASAQMMQAYKDEQFRKTMFERGAMSKAEFDQAVLTRIQRVNMYEETLSNIESRRMSVSKLKQELEKVNITFTFDGVLLPANQSINTNQKEGQVADLTVLQGQMVGQSAVLCRLANIDEVFVALDVPAKDLLEIQVGQDVELEIYSRVGHSFTGKVYDISTALNSGTRTYTVNIRVENKEHMLRPGMFAKAQIITHEKQDALSIPRNIIQVRNNREVVFIAKPKPQPEENAPPDSSKPSGTPTPSPAGDKPVVTSDASQKIAYAAEPPKIDEATSDDPSTLEKDEEVGSDTAKDEVEMIVEEREITRGIENRESVEVVEGLREGEMLVVLGYETLTNGVDVNITIQNDESGLEDTTSMP